MDIFAPGYPPINGCFVVRNISPQNKTINIFQYPINEGCTRDILKIPGVAEQDIRASLLKGELRHKIRSGDIVVICSDIDLLQFNDAQKTFLQSAGIVNGLQIGSDQMAILEQLDIELIGTVDGANTIFTIPSGVWIQEDLYKIIVYRNGVKQVLGDDYFISESGGTGTGFDTVIMSEPPVVRNGIPDVMTADYFLNNS